MVLPTRQVRVIGIGGPSCSGKSTLAMQLAKQLRSPLVPLCADWYFKPVKAFDRCASCKSCWELPTSVNSELLVRELHKLMETLRTSGEVELTTMRRTFNATAEGAELLEADEPVYVVLEGFVLFSDPRVVKLLYAAVWLDLPFEEGAMRRFLRQAGDPAKAGAFERYRDIHYKHIYDHHLEFRHAQLTNVAIKLVCRIDALLAPEAVLNTATIALKTNLMNAINLQLQPKGKRKASGTPML